MSKEFKENPDETKKKEFHARFRHEEKPEGEEEGASIKGGKDKGDYPESCKHCGSKRHKSKEHEFSAKSKKKEMARKMRSSS